MRARAVWLLALVAGGIALVLQPAASSSSSTGPSSPPPASGAPTARAIPNATPGSLVWADDFNGPAGSPPDRHRWVITPGPGDSGTLETYTARAANVCLDGHGHLAITARRAGRAYTSARVRTRRVWKFGTIEARIKVPPGRGLWPAFWALGADYSLLGWPACGEIDVMEILGQKTHRVHASVHDALIESSIGTAVPEDLSRGFHIYGVTWTALSVSMSVDGTTYATFPLPFDEPVFFVLDLQVGGPQSWPGAANGSTRFPATMLVDWVRIYQSRRGGDT